MSASGLGRGGPSREREREHLAKTHWQMSLMSSSLDVVLDDELRLPGTIPERAILLRRRIQRGWDESCSRARGGRRSRVRSSLSVLELSVSESAVSSVGRCRGDRAGRE